MPTESIFINITEMRKVSTNINATADEWDGAVKKISNLVVEMDAMWDGLGNDTFNAIWKSDAASFSKLTLLMREYAAAVKAVADTYDAAEQEVRGIVSRR